MAAHIKQGGETSHPDGHPVEPTDQPAVFPCFDAVRIAQIVEGAIRDFDFLRNPGAAGPVSDQWTAWLRAHQARLGRVVILVADRYVTQTMAVAKHFSRTGDLIQITSDRGRFEQAVEKSAIEKKR